MRRLAVGLAAAGVIAGLWTAQRVLVGALHLWWRRRWTSRWPSRRLADLAHRFELLPAELVDRVQVELRREEVFVVALPCLLRRSAWTRARRLRAPLATWLVVTTLRCGIVPTPWTPDRFMAIERPIAGALIPGRLWDRVYFGPPGRPHVEAYTAPADRGLWQEVLQLAGRSEVRRF